MIRQLSTNEIRQVSGANWCNGNNFSPEMWKRMQADAHREATASGVIAGAALGLSALYLGAPVITTTLVATMVGQAVYQYDYQNYEFWPWNF
ncbi:hypothetical protein [Candidatus Berkiella aquae]|uniref:Uncharacterized protein n=1 Tax=Candidatus Berkiella aquae TaxID=295108 RepID=A0A0Q9YKX1_9GAMM|nr:hypothetical protein [Candidatus Berkiella aquae]MCS5710941.1 hypothetical protein [Candidatus Berkiella aquae]